MKIIPKLLLGLLLIAPGLQASEASKPKTDTTQQKTDEILDKMLEEEINEALAQAEDPKKAALELLCSAVDSGDVAKAKKVIVRIDMDKFPTNIMHPFFRTIDPETIQLLITHKSDVNVRNHNHFNRTPLIYYCFMTAMGSTFAPQCVELLLDQRGIHVNAQDDKGYTALHELMASYSAAKLPLVTKLLERNADPYIANNLGETIPSMLVLPRIARCTALIDPLITACVAQRPHRVHGLALALASHLTKDTAGIVIGYLPEGFEEETSKKAANTALTKTSE